ncbi:hypothetical protein O181_078557, partial [Austropuccinia psidii MF-1]|nr:hypothetical protein [Austropuccinia psidii MF-1]
GVFHSNYFYCSFVLRERFNRLWAVATRKAYTMSDKKFDIDDLRAALSVSDSGAILKRQVEIDRLGEGITPRLTSDGLTFHRWY